MKFKKLFLIALLILFYGCSITRLQESGCVSPREFYSKITFDTYKSVIGFDAEVNGEVKKFLFDTGADLSLLQKDLLTGKASKYSGASKRKMELQKELVSSIIIGEAVFNDTYALSGNMTGLKEQIPNFGGLIGQSIIKKANWLINYPNRQLELSNKSLADNTFMEIELIRENGNNPYTYVEIEGSRYKVLIDFGSSSTMNLPKGSKLAKEVSKSIQLTENTRDRYTLGGLQTITEEVGIIPKVKLGGFEFSNVDVNINTSSQPRIGVALFKDFSIYIDNTNGGVFKLKKVQ